MLGVRSKSQIIDAGDAFGSWQFMFVIGKDSGPRSLLVTSSRKEKYRHPHHYRHHAEVPFPPSVTSRKAAVLARAIYTME